MLQLKDMKTRLNQSMPESDDELQSAKKFNKVRHQIRYIIKDMLHGVGLGAAISLADYNQSWTGQFLFKSHQVSAFPVIENAPEWDCFYFQGALSLFRNATSETYFAFSRVILFFLLALTAAW